MTSKSGLPNSSNPRKANPDKGNASRYLANDLSTILFLSKRGISRSPLAREALRKVLASSSHFGRFRIACRGVTEAYDQCPLDLRMKEAISHIKEYTFDGLSRFALKPDLAKADLILTMDEESEIFVKENMESIRGEVRPFGLFLPPGSLPHLPDPFLERKEHHEAHYAELIYLIEKGCGTLVESIPSLTG
jgi:protein-tyrosine-phosphatase